MLVVRVLTKRKSYSTLNKNINFVQLHIFIKFIKREAQTLPDYSRYEIEQNKNFVQFRGAVSAIFSLYHPMLLPISVFAAFDQTCLL